MSDKQLPTLRPGDSHMESLIEAAIQGHADTRDAMRWLVRQLVPVTQPVMLNGLTEAETYATASVMGIAKATQPAEVTDDLVEKATVETFQKTGADLIPEVAATFARAIISLRPVQVPMTDEQADALATEAFGEYMCDLNDDIELALVRKVEAHHGITAQADLWCIHIPGPDEVHAAPSKEAADHMAAKHNAAMATFYSSGAPNLEFAPSIENVQAVAIKWPYDQQSHADELREFDYASWGITTQAKKEGV